MTLPLTDLGARGIEVNETYPTHVLSRKTSKCLTSHRAHLKSFPIRHVSQ